MFCLKDCPSEVWETFQVRSVVDKPGTAAGKGSKDHSNCTKCNKAQPDAFQTIALGHDHDHDHPDHKVDRLRCTGCSFHQLFERLP